MGTMIHLSIGAFQIDWGKNSFFPDHTSLFQATDLKQVLDCGYEEPLEMEGYSRKLGDMVSRLELLGHTLPNIKKEFKEAKNQWDISYYPSRLSFVKFLDCAKIINIAEITGKWRDDQPALFIPNEIINNLDPYHDYHRSRPDYWDVEVFFGGLSPYSILRILAENPKNLDVPVLWPFGELVDNGWAKRSQFIAKLDKENRFLIVTEGSSDSKIISKALSLLRSDIADFFRFIDMEDGYPFSGTGNLYKFSQGLVSIGISAPVMILYDNDTEGVNKYEATKKLKLPPNMIIAKLPNLKELTKFQTVGPYGSRKCDINGRAASIECYLDLNHKKLCEPPCVRWTSYSENMGEYQGAIEKKTAYVKVFLNQKSKVSGYDYSKLEAVLDHIYKLSLMIRKEIN